MNKPLHRLIPFIISVLCTFSPTFGQTPACAYGNQAFLKWNEVFLEIDRYAPGFRPSPGPRSLAYMGLSAYESVVHTMPRFNSLRSQLPGLTLPTAQSNAEYFHPATVNESYYYMMHHFFYYLEKVRPVEFAKIEKTYQDCRKLYVGRVPAAVLTRSEAFGKAMAKAICDWETLDVVGHDAFLTPQPPAYVPPVGDGLWQPTAPDFSRAAFPDMGKSRYFALKGAEQLSVPPLPYSENPNSALFKEAEEVFKRTNAVNERKPGSYEDRWIAEFWSDDLLNVTFSPPSRLLSIANQVAKRENLNLAECAELYAKLGLALNDAGAATWKSKYHYNIERPVSYIRRVLKNKYPSAATWLSSLNNPLTGVKGLTPAFPAYPSGHSAFGGAGGKVLSSLFENNNRGWGGYFFIDLSHLGRTEFIGTPRFYFSFKQLAEEDAISRIPLGVHYRQDCTEGVRLGELAAKRVLEMPWKKTGGYYLAAQQPTVTLEANAEYNRVRLDWIAAGNGAKVDYFNVQKQNPTTGIFEHLTTLNAKPTTDAEFYSSLDDKPTEGSNFYQIKAIFADGSSQKSGIQQVNFKGAGTLRVFPNPASDLVNVDMMPFEGVQVTITVFNQVGKLVRSATVEKATATAFELDLGDAPAGSYIIKVQPDGRRSVSKTVQIVR
jgi:Secretion system C-terminal sorting domain/PAP2 superfamily